MYSLVNASALGFDLVRLPGGPAVAAVLLDALAARPLTGPVTSARPGEPEVPAPRWATAREVLGAVGSAGGGHLLPPDLAPRLAVAPLGTIADLHRFVSRDVVGWTSSDVPDLATRDDRATTRAATVHALVEQAWATSAPRPAGRRPLGDLGPSTTHLAELLDGVAGLDAAGLARVDEAATRTSRSGRWATAMHDVTLALDLSGRLRTSALAQLHLVLALRAGAAPTTAAAGSVWNGLSGLVAATVVQDLVSDETAAVLVVPYTV